MNGSISEMRHLSWVKHHRAERYADQRAPGGAMKVYAPPLSFCQLSEVYLQHPQVSVSEEEERGKAGVLTLG